MENSESYRYIINISVDKDELFSYLCKRISDFDDYKDYRLCEVYTISYVWRNAYHYYPSNEDPAIVIPEVYPNPKDHAGRSFLVIGQFKFDDIIDIISRCKRVSRDQINLFSDRDCNDRICDDSHDVFIDPYKKNIYKKPDKSPLSIDKVDKSPDFVRRSSILSMKNILSDFLGIPSSFFQLFTGTDKCDEINDVDELTRNNPHIAFIFDCIKHIDDSSPFIELVSKGELRSIYKCTDVKSNRVMAIKMFELNRKIYQKAVSFNNETSILKLLGSHPRIIQFLISIKTDDAYYISMEFMAGGSLGSLVRNKGALPEDKIAKYAHQILEGLEYLHKKMIIHRDIKGDNILLDPYQINIKLGGFELAKNLSNVTNFDPIEGAFQSAVGTPNWMAPEIICDEPYGFSVDIWSFGATMVEMVTGQIPFHDNNSHLNVIFKIGTNKRIDYSYPASGSESMREFMDLCLKSNSHERATIDELLKHEFLINESRLLDYNLNSLVFDTHSNSDNLIDGISKENNVLPLQIVLSGGDTTILYRKFFYKLNPLISCVPIDINGETSEITYLSDISLIKNHLSKRLGIPSSFFKFFTDKDKRYEINDAGSFIPDYSLFEYIYYSVVLIGDTFALIKSVGEGAFGQVYKCTDVRFNRIMAIKQLKNIKVEKLSSFNEVSIVKLLERHPRIIEFHKSIETDDTVYIPMEYMIGGSLGSLVRNKGALPEDKIAKYAHQILEGLQYLHSKGIIHRDIKGDNILLDHDGNVKLSDFGLAKHLSIASNFNLLEGVVQSRGGTPNWTAPEIICGQPCGFPVDIWSFGATMVEMVTGQIPFHNNKNLCNVTFKIGTNKRIDYSYPASGSESMREFMDLCLKSNSHERATIDELLKHQFLSRPSEFVS